MSETEIEELQQELEDAEGRIEDLETEVGHLEDEISDLEYEVREAEKWEEINWKLQNEIEELKEREKLAEKIISQINPERGELYDLITEWRT